MNSILLLVLSILSLIGCVHLESTQPPTVIDKVVSTIPLPACGADYNRKEWGQWRDDDKNCLKTRDEILKRDSLSAARIEKCKVKSGIWRDFYFGDEVNDPKKLEIDHVVPVKEAHDSGGCNWSKDQKRQYYNDPENLVIATIKNNRSKSANSIAVWQPKDKVRACEQAKIWAKIKKKYGLVIKPDEMTSLRLLARHGCSLAI